MVKLQCKYPKDQMEMSLMVQCHSLTTIVTYNDEGVDGFPPKVNEDIEEQVIKECKIVECQFFELKVILPSCGMPKVVNEDGSTYIFQPQSLSFNIKKVEDEKP